MIVSCCRGLDCCILLVMWVGNAGDLCGPAIVKVICLMLPGNTRRERLWQW